MTPPQGVSRMGVDLVHIAPFNNVHTIMMSSVTMRMPIFIKHMQLIVTNQPDQFFCTVYC